jgi:competence ComEA-like helix-hairpin-helix protein
MTSREKDLPFPVPGRSRSAAGLFTAALALLGIAFLAGQGGLRGGGEPLGGVSLPDLCLDVNSASRDELVSLPEVGPALAANMEEARRTRGEFGALEDLLEVRGIGKKKLARIETWITLRGECGISGSAE